MTSRLRFLLLCICGIAALPQCQAEVTLRIESATAKQVGDVWRVQAAGGNDVTNVQIVVTFPKGTTYVAGSIRNARSNSTAVKPVSPVASDTSKTIQASIEKSDRDTNLELTVTAIIGPVADGKSESAIILIYVDSTKPSPLQPVIEQFPGGGATIVVPFVDADLDPKSMRNGNFRIFEEVKPQEGAVVFRRIFPEGDPVLSGDGRSVRLEIPNLNPGAHYLQIHSVSDVVGNALDPADDSFTPNETEKGVYKSFNISGGQLRGQQVEYPRFLHVGGEKASDIDPGDRVDTRVVNLYYMRDARQVAEIINRNIQDLNQVGYDKAQQAAERARGLANDAVDQRRFRETQSVEAAIATRQTEARIRETQDKLAQAREQKDAAEIKKKELDEAIVSVLGGQPVDTLGTAISSTDAAIQKDRTAIVGKEDELNKANETLGKLKNASPVDGAAVLQQEQQIQKLQNEIATLQSDVAEKTRKVSVLLSLQAKKEVTASASQTAKNAVNALENELTSDKLPAQLQRQQEAEIRERNLVLQAEQRELRTSQEQFRQEVNAGLADRNSYARGKPESKDPVAQVTISVVGTSRLQLRGPVKGLNKICRMIHQLDSPVGQVKVGIHTVQINGEHGDRMDFVYERINQDIAHSRFLVNASGQLLRRAVQEVANEVALAADQGYLPPDCPPELTAGTATLNGTVQSTQDLRDRRYLYAFFGSDFISELEEMDSELLNTENKLLSLHSMDSISLAGAMFVLAHADHPVRQQILLRFQELIAGDLPMREAEFVQSLTHVTRHGKSLDHRFRKAMKIDEKQAAEIYFNAARTYHFPNTISFFNNQISTPGTLNPVQQATLKMAQALKAQLTAEIEYTNFVVQRSLLETTDGELEEEYIRQFDLSVIKRQKAEEASEKLTAASAPLYDLVIQSLEQAASEADEADYQLAAEIMRKRMEDVNQTALLDRIYSIIDSADNEREEGDASDSDVKEKISDLIESTFGVNQLLNGTVEDFLEKPLATWTAKQDEYLQTKRQLTEARALEAVQKASAESAKKRLLSKRLLEQFMDDQEEKSVELMEALRSHASNVDNYLKRLATAVDEDVAAQFYEPAFQRIRRVSRTWDVTLSQIETTTVLTNNRTMALVSPAASFEFNLPKRDILIKEAMDGAKALALEYGNLMKDGTFLAGTSMLAGTPPEGIVGNNAPIQGLPGLNNSQEFGSELQKLIPEPAIYKFETGTGFAVQPVIQPDGNSIIYGFDYTYTTQVREPVRADEKHLGRVKRHFVRTDVQTSSYELREISRYTVALKASRTDRGVPLFEDIPVIGAAFRPLPSQESSLQTNIILGSSTIYPTVYDLMGLRWSQHVDQMSSESLKVQKQELLQRRDHVRDHLIRTTREEVYKSIGLETPASPDVQLIVPERQ